MTIKWFSASLLLTAFTIGTLPDASAAVVRNVSIAAVSSEYVSGGDQRRATNMIAGNDLIGEGHVASGAGTTWLSSPTTAGAVTNAFVTFDLGSVRTLTGMKVWNYNEAQSGANVLTRRGIQTADISFSSDNVTFTTNLPNQTFLRAPGAFANFAQTFALSNLSARYVRINVLSNFGEGDNRVGLSEVQFVDTTTAPLLLTATRNFGQNRVTLTFSESLQASSATNPANYSISGGAVIQDATLDAFGNIVYLQTSTLVSNQVYTVSAQNVRDAANTASITNTLLTIDPELALWLKADAGVTADGSSLVSEWADQSGNNNNAIQPNTLNKPTLVPNALNGKPVLRFNGSSTVTNFLDVAHSSSLVTRRDLTIYSVVRAQDFTTLNAIVGKTAGNQPAPIDFYLINNTGQPRMYRGNGAGGSGVFGTRNLTAGTDATNYYLVSTVIAGTNASLYLNGALNGSGPMTAAAKDHGKLLRVGSRDDFATRLKGDLAEVIIIRGALSSAERDSLDSYIGSKYGIAIVSLNITQHPVGTNVLEGQSATFRVSAVANNPAINYQWQRNGVDIAGATESSYTISSVLAADHNSSYRVSVSIPGTTQLSDSALLTVVPDVAAPTLISVGKKFWATTDIVVTFSEKVSTSSATTLGNYTINNGISVVSATLRSDSSSVVLKTSPNLSSSQAYSLTVQNVRDRFNNTIVQTTQTIGTHPMVPALFLKASDGVVTDGVGYVSQWNDQSGNGNHVAQPSGGEYQPFLNTNAFNGRPALNFDGSTDFLYCDSSPSLQLTGDMSVFAAVRFNDFANFNAIVTKTAANLPAPFDFYLLANTGQPRLYRGDGGANLAQVTATAPPSLGVPHLLAVTMKGTTVTHYLDGATNGTGTLNTVIADNGAPLGIGTRDDLATKAKGDFAEIAVLPGVMADIDRREFETYLNAKYAFFVPPTPPTFTVSRSGNNVTLSWQTTAGFVLEAADAVVDASWAPINSGITDVSGTSSITTAASGSRKFYRLRK